MIKTWELFIWRDRISRKVTSDPCQQQVFFKICLSILGSWGMQVLKLMFSQPIVSVLCCFISCIIVWALSQLIITLWWQAVRCSCSNNCWCAMFIPIFVDCVISALNYYALSCSRHVLFKTAASQAKGETTAMQSRAHPSQEKLFALLGTLKLHAARECILFCHSHSGRNTGSPANVNLYCC